MKTFCLHSPKTIILAAIFAVSLNRSANGASTNYVWNVSTPSSASTWNTAGNWLPAAGFPGAGGDTADTVTFNNTGVSSSASSANNDVIANTTVSTLNYTNTGTGNWQVTDIGAGVTLMVTNLTIGIADNGLSDVAMLDAGTLAVNGSMTVGGVQTANAIEVVNFGGLSNFIFNASSGTMNFGPANDCIVNLTLAGVSNKITAGTIDYNVNDTSSSSTTTFILGGGTNIINANTFLFGAGRNTSTLEFPSGSTTAGLLLQGAGGAGTLCNMVIGNRNNGGGSGNTINDNVLLDGYPVNLFFQTLTEGESGSNPSAAAHGNGLLAFDTGTVYASNIVLAVATGTANNTAAASGTINVGSTTSVANPTLIIGAGGMSMVNQGSLSGPSTGFLNITNATVISSNSIVKTTTAGTATIVINGGTLDMVAGTIGTSAAPIDNVAIDGALVLSVSGTSSSPLVFGSTITASGGTIIITNVTQVTSHVSIPLISYNVSDGDPASGLVVVVPNGYSGSLSDDDNGIIDLSISPAGVVISDLLWKGAVGATLNSNWDNGITPDWINLATSLSSAYTNPAVVVFDDSALNSTVILATNVTPSSLTFSNSVLNYSLSGTGSIGGSAGLVMDGSATTILSESGTDTFSGGIVINDNGKVILDDANDAISGGLNISSGATAQIGTNDNNGSLPAGGINDNGTLIFDHTTITDTVTTPISGTGVLVQNGSGTVSFSTTNGYTGATTVNAGTLALTGSGSISNSAAVTFNNAVLNLSGLSGPALMQSVTFNNSTQTLALPSQSFAPLNIYNGGISLQGPTNVINVTVLPPIAYFPTTLQLISGPIVGRNFNMGLGSLTNGYQGFISEGSGGYDVLLTITSGPLGVRPSVSWVGTDAANSGVTNWSDANNWELPGPPTPVDNVDFADAGVAAGTPFNATGDGSGGIANPQYVNNFVNTSFTVGTLTYSNVVPTDYQNTFIQNGASLNVVSNGSLVVGSESTDYGSSAATFATIGGTNGTLNVKNTNGTVFVGLGSGSVASQPATLDLSGLGTFNANVSRLLVGVGSGSEGIALARLSGILYLAQTNTITASIAVSGAETSDTAANAEAIDIGDADGNGGNATFLYLGQTNAFYADAIAMGRQKEVSTMEFNPNYTSLNIIPSVYIRGASASAVGTFSIGDGVVNSGSGENTEGTCDFTTISGGSDGYVNALINTMYIGRSANNISGSGTVSGTLNFDNGIFNVGTMFVGLNPTNVAKFATGTVNVNTNSTLGVSGTLSVSGNLIIAQTAAGGIVATGVLNIAGGTVTANSIVCDAHGGNSTITLGNNSLGGTLSVANTIGAPGAALTTLNLDGGTLELEVDGFASVTNIVATSVTTSGTTTLQINSLFGVQTGTAYPLISYTGADPYSSLTFAPLPAGYAGTLMDNTANDRIDLVLTVAPPITSPLLTSISVSGNTLTFSATNGEGGAPYTLYGTTNLAPPVVWKPVFTNTFSADGTVDVSTNVITTNTQSEFFKLEEP